MFWQVNAKTYIRQLEDRRPLKRLEAIKALEAFPEPEVTYALIKEIIREYDRAAQKAAREALVKRGRQAVPPLLKSYADNTSLDLNTVTELLEAIEALQDPETADAVLAMFAASDYLVKSKTALLLGKIRDARAVESLCRALDYMEVDPKDTALGSMLACFLECLCIALGEIGDSRAVEPMAELLKREYMSFLNGFRVTNAALEALASIRNDRAVDVLLASLNGDGIQMSKACKILGHIKEERAVEPLIRFLSDDDKSGYRMTFIEALGEINDVRAVEPLIGLLGDELPEIRTTACRALSSFRDGRAASAIRQYKHRLDEAFFVSAILPLLPDWRHEERDTSDKIRSLGEEANEIGGFEMMRRIHYTVYRSNNLLGQYLSAAWDNVGRWVS